MSDKTGGVAAFTSLIDLVSDQVGGRALLTSDDFFAGCENLTRPEPAVFDPSAYTDHGKLMDGWESRRRRTPGHDWCILALGVPGRIRAVDMDTAHFLGNHAPYGSLQGTRAPEGADAAWLRDRAEWTPVVPQTALQRGSQNLCASVSGEVFTHVRLNMYPDGGIARLRVMGEPATGTPEAGSDLACVLQGGRAVACSDAFFSPMHQLILPGSCTYMGGGWETRRSRPPAADWIVIQLGAIGTVDRLEVDTHHFKGNFPDQVAIDGILWPDAPPTALRDSVDWTELVPPSRVGADATVTWSPSQKGPFSHLRVRITPDGGIARLRAFGSPAEPTVEGPLATLSSEDLARCCGATRWVDQMSRIAFTSPAHLLGMAEWLWWHLDAADWGQAFDHHPRIGADLGSFKDKFAATKAWSETEQAGVAGASEQTLAALAQSNRAYEERFGHLFLVCASGLSAAEMVARMQDRMHNTPDNELRIAAGEQAKITRLRLQKLLEITYG